MGNLSLDDSGESSESGGAEDSWFSIADMQLNPVLHRFCAASLQL